MNRSDEISAFLKKLYKCSYNQHLNHNTIYQFLEYETIKKSDMKAFAYEGVDVINLFSKWYARFQNKKNSWCSTSHPYFFLFDSKRNIVRYEFIKLYVPLDKEHLEEGVNLLFDFLDKENIIHTSKVARKVRADNVIIRIDKDDIGSRDKIINFINTNPYFKNAFNRVNPFVPTIGNIGIMEEHGNSYNTDISYYIANYLEQSHKYNYKIENINADDFYKYLKYCQDNNLRFDDKGTFDPSLLTTYEEALKGTNIVDKKQQKVSLNEDKIEYTKEQKRTMFMDALKTTFKHYGEVQVCEAINRVINYSDFDYLSNKGCSFNLREVLRHEITNNDALNIVNNYLINKNMYNQNMSLNDKIALFVNQMFKNDLAFKFDEICNVTLEKYGSEALNNAIKAFVYEGNVKRFSRFTKNSDFNYRSNLKFFNRKGMYEVIKESLINKGVMVDKVTMDELIEMYCYELSKTLYTYSDNRPQMSK